MHTTQRIVLTLALGASLFLAGCTAGGEALYSYGGSDSMTAGGSNLQDVQDSFEVPGGKAQIALSIGGTGSAKITIKDADGKAVYTKSVSGSGGAAESKVMEGTAGTWTIAIDFTNYQGGFALDIRSA